jgi:hypothetical protein
MVAAHDEPRALAEGAYRSLRACSVSAGDPLVVAIWHRYKWSIIGFALFILLELVGLFSLISGGMPRS